MQWECSFTWHGCSPGDLIQGWLSSAVMLRDFTWSCYKTDDGKITIFDEKYMSSFLLCLPEAVLFVRAEMNLCLSISSSGCSSVLVLGMVQARYSHLIFRPWIVISTVCWLGIAAGCPTSTKYLPLIIQFNIWQGFISGINLSTKHQFIDASVPLSNLINAVIILKKLGQQNINNYWHYKIVLFLEYREKIIWKQSSYWLPAHSVAVEWVLHLCSSVLQTEVLPSCDKCNIQ